MPAEIAPRHVTVSHGIKFRRRSRTIVDVVQEHYLRDDIPCGSAVCDICHQTPVLSGTATHYLLPDVDFILDFLELLEHPQIANVIYLSSIAKQVLESSNQRKYTRLRALYRDRRRRSILFDDEHSIPVFVRRKDILKQQNGGNLRSAGLRVGVTKVVDSERLCTGAGIENTFEADDDDDVKWKKLLRGHRSKSASFAGIQAAAEWYSEHLEARIPIVVVSDVLSTDGCGIATPLNFCSPAETNEGSLTTIQILSSAEYIQRWWAGDASVAELYDSLVRGLRMNEV
ncbi:hypothetical protein CBR_g18665 [Chara braunii]|uniref:Uncharacterized protein n=1 Tax=Chara braunii TaxID=69332 RepID=A0A388JTJ1_CHABU|nr:hypothetical protein CBR_g18665 [Chara braunii]|eukprot:GBG61073.1 hypothetical protein CBR_g18665 [Chara braunii]